MMYATEIRENSHCKGMVVVDLDGTLRARDGTVAEEDLLALEEAGRAGYLRVIATGRSLFSFSERAGGLSLPVDYVVFSTGLGVYRMADGEVFRRGGLTAVETEGIVRRILPHGVDFMIHAPVPDTHRFQFHDAGTGSPDFARRVALYPDHCRPIDGAPEEASQLLVIAPVSELELISSLESELPEQNVVRTTSPLDHESLWIEIFPGNISKGRTVAWLAEESGLTAFRVLAVGNDYNDLDLLEWAGTSFVVSGAPEELRRRFGVVPPCAAGEIASAIRGWCR